MKEFQYFMLGFSVAMLMTSIARNVTGENEITKTAHYAIEQCEMELPRNEHCELKGEPITKEGGV